MKKKSLFCLFSISFVVIIVAILFCSCTKGKLNSNDLDFSKMNPIKIKYAHAIADGELMNYFIKDWIKEVEKRSQNKITFDYYPHGQLGSFVEIIEQVEIGAVDMSSGEPSLYEPWCPEISMLYAPLICSGYEHLGKCIYGEPGKLIEKAMSENNNTYILDWVFSGARVIASKKPLRTLSDMKGVEIRSPESQVYIDTFTLLGMSPTPLPMNEMLNALKTGMVDACECPAQALFEGGYHKVTGNICKTRHMYSLGTLSVNEKFWDSVPTKAKNLMLSIWSEMKDKFNKHVVDSEEEYYKKFIKENVNVTDFEDRDKFEKIAQPYWEEKARSIGGSAEKILDEINALR